VRIKNKNVDIEMSTHYAPGITFTRDAHNSVDSVWQTR